MDVCVFDGWTQDVFPAYGCADVKCFVNYEQNNMFVYVLLISFACIASEIICVFYFLGEVKNKSSAYQ